MLSAAPERVFPDTNTLLSGMLFAGNESRLLEIAAHGGIVLVLAECVLAEAREVLARKFPASVGICDRWLATIPYVLAPEPSAASVARLRTVITGPADALILAAAAGVGVDVLVSGDRHFHTSAVAAVIRVMRCSDYLIHHRATRGQAT